jgi:hypothetical protein
MTARRIFFNGFMSKTKFAKAGPKLPLTYNSQQLKLINGESFFGINLGFNESAYTLKRNTKWVVDNNQLTVANSKFIKWFPYVPPNDFLVKSLTRRDPTLHEIIHKGMNIEDPELEVYRHQCNKVNGYFFKGSGFLPKDMTAQGIYA